MTAGEATSFKTIKAPDPSEIDLDVIAKHTNLDDIWDDADMLPVLHYLRANRNFALPAGWREKMAI